MIDRTVDSLCVLFVLFVFFFLLFLAGCVTVGRPIVERVTIATRSGSKIDPWSRDSFKRDKSQRFDTLTENHGDRNGNPEAARRSCTPARARISHRFIIHAGMARDVSFVRVIAIWCRVYPRVSV